MGKSFFIDFENVRERGLTAISCRSGDFIYLLSTNNAPKISIDVLADVDAAIKFIKVAAGKQSLDMHLVSLLGYTVHEKGKNEGFVIVSNDGDYDSVVQFWRSKGYNVNRQGVPEQEPEKPQERSQERPQEKPQEKPQSQKEAAQPTNGEAQKMVKLLQEAGVAQAVCDFIVNLLASHPKSKMRKTELYREIIKKYGQQNGLKYYNVIKKEL